MADADDFRLIRDVVAHGGLRQTLGNVDRTISVWWTWTGLTLSPSTLATSCIR
jgi:hypothetical protein